LPDFADGLIRPDNTCARECGRLRSRLIFSSATHARDRHPDGAGRTPASGYETDHRPGNETGWVRDCPWVAGSMGSDPVAKNFAIRRQRDRCIVIWADGLVIGGRGAVGLLLAGGARFEGRPADRIELRVSWRSYLATILLLASATATSL